MLNDSRSEPVERRPDGLTDDVVYPDLDPVQSLNTVNHTSPTKPLPRNDSRDLDDDWNQNDDTVLLKLADEAMAPPSAPITPRKAIKKDYQDTPGKRNFDKMNTPSTSTGSGSDDIFTTPATNATGRGLFPTVKHGLISPFETPTPQRFHNVPSSVLDSPTKLKTPNAEDFSAELLSILREGHCMVSPATEAAITSACTRQVLKIHGMEKSRNMLRNIIKTRDGTIAELQQSRAQLESERESLRNVIRHLKEKDSGGGLMMPTSY